MTVGLPNREVRGLETSWVKTLKNRMNQLSKTFPYPESPPGQAGHAGWYPAEATIRKKEILRPSHSPSVEADFPSVSRRKQWGSLGRIAEGWNSRGAA